MMPKRPLFQLLVAAFFTVAVAKDIEFNCTNVDGTSVDDVEYPVSPAELIDADGLNFVGCPGSFVRFDMVETGDEAQDFECDFELGGELPKLTLETFDSGSLVAKSEGKDATVDCSDSASAPPFTMTATMVVAKYPYYPPVEDGVDTVKVTDIEANSRVVQRFNGVNQNDVLLDFDLNFGMPSLGYVLVRNGNGRMMALAGQTGPAGEESWRRVKIAVPSGFNNTPVDVLIVGQNSIEDFSNAKPVKIDYSIDEAVTTNAPTTTTTVPTTAEDPLNNLVELFNVAVDENEFVAVYYADLKAKVQALATNCTVAFDAVTGGNPVSCREECWMTNLRARGCVLVRADVIKDIYCPYSNRQLRQDLTDSVRNQWAKQFDAARISVDDCMADSVGWIVVAVLMPIAVVGLFIGGFFAAKVWKKKRQFELKKQQSEAFERKRRGNSQSGEKKGFGGSGGASRFAYTNRLEILDEED